MKKNQTKRPLWQKLLLNENQGAYIRMSLNFHRNVYTQGKYQQHTKNRNKKRKANDKVKKKQELKFQQKKKAKIIKQDN